MATRRRVGHIPTDPKSLERWQRDITAVKMRASGLSFAKIAQELGFKTASGAHEAVQRYLRTVTFESAEALRDIELQTLNLVQQKLMTDILESGKGRARNAEVLMKLMERRARLLGLDSPEKVDHQLTGPTIVNYIRDPRQEEHQRKLAPLLEGTVLESSDVDELPAARSPDPGDEHPDQGDSAGGGDGSGEDLAGSSLGLQET